MKDKNKEEIVVLKKENKLFTKDRVISLTIGIFIGIVITSCTFCICNRMHHPKFYDNQIRTQERNMQSMPRRRERIAKKKYRINSNQTIEENNTKNE